MAKISTYATDSQVSASDKLIGTDADNSNETKNFTVGGLAAAINAMSLAELVLIGESPNNQAPVAADTPLQVEFGPAQNGGTDMVMLDVLGNVTINETGSYFIRFKGNFDKKAAPGVATIYFRMLINGVQYGGADVKDLDTINLNEPFETSLARTFNATDVISFEFYVSSLGVLAGGLYVNSAGPVVAWGDVPSASIQIYRFK